MSPRRGALELAEAVEDVGEKLRLDSLAGVPHGEPNVGALAFKTDLVYQGLESGYSSSPNPRSVGARWKYDQGDPNVPVVVRNTDAPPGGTPPWLKRAMDLNPNLRTFVATGMFDSLNSCAGNTYLLSQIPPERSSKITFDCYEGGHMMYEDRESRSSLKRDVARFYRP